MPLRVIAYDGSSYRSQMLKKESKEFCKVITLVLNFGENQWNGDKELKDVINKKSGDENLFQNYKLNVFNVAYLSDEQVKMFQSDFGIVADYFTKRRKGNKSIENNKPIKHVDEMLKFMSVFAEDGRFLNLNVKKDKEGAVTMCTILDAVEEKGITKGEDAILKLVNLLLVNYRIDDIEKIYEDKEYRHALMKEYKIMI